MSSADGLAAPIETHLFPLRNVLVLLDQQPKEYRVMLRLTFSDQTYLSYLSSSSVPSLFKPLDTLANGCSLNFTY